MALKAEDKDVELVAKVIVKGEDALTKEEKVALEQSLSKRTSLEDVMHLLGLYYPELTKEELSTVMSRMYSQQPETKEEADIMDKAAHKHPSTIDVVNLLKTFSSKSVMPRIADMQDEILTLQIIVHDYMVSKVEFKKLIDKLYKEYQEIHPDNDDKSEDLQVEDKESEFVKKAYRTLISSKLVMTKQDYADVISSKNEKLKEAAERANKALKMTAEATKKIKHG